MTNHSAKLTANTPLNEVRDIYTFFHEPANMPLIQVDSDKTLYAWQNMSGFQYTMQVVGDGWSIS